VLQVAEMEAQNSEDPSFVDRVNKASENLKASEYWNKRNLHTDLFPFMT
jgi:hypothetical protein